MNTQAIKKQTDRIQGYAELLDKKKRYSHNPDPFGFMDKESARFIQMESPSAFEKRREGNTELIRYIERRLATAIEDLTKLT